MRQKVLGAYRHTPYGSTMYETEAIAKLSNK